MSPALSIIVFISIAGVSVGVAASDFVGSRAWRVILSALLAAAALALLYASASQQDVELKGPAQETVAVACCYLAMVLGMVAQYCYRQAENGAQTLTFKPTELLMPIFASPIVFIPLLTITTDVTLSGAFTKAKLMVYFVAFQNGFFWKNFFEELRQKSAASASLA